MKAICYLLLFQYICNRNVSISNPPNSINRTKLKLFEGMPSEKLDGPEKDKTGPATTLLMRKSLASNIKN